MSYTGPKAKKARRLGVALSPKTGKYLETRPHPPGQHGRSRRPRKASDYGRQLMEKQRLRYQYNVSEKQLRRAYQKASKSQESTPDVLIHLLETRLDNLVLRAGFARSIYAARQYVAHGHILVNGKRVDIPSYQVKINDQISVAEKSKDVDCFKYAVSLAEKVPYVTVDDKKMTANLNYIPTREEIPVICDVPVVVEFYSR